MFIGLTCTSFAQKQYTTPVPILKQINRHNEDGSYSYGYEAADGSFKIETKSASGEVKGKYGYIDDNGNTREIEYGANKNGFQPTGDGINVAPPAPDNRDSSYPALQSGEIDDGQYREDPLMYNDPRYNSKPSKSTQFRVNSSPAPRPAQPAYRPQQQQQQQAVYRAHQQPAAPYRAQQQVYEEEPEVEQPYYQSRFTAQAAPSANFYQQPKPQQNFYQQPQPQQNFYRPSNNYYQQPDQVDIFQGHPASNLDLSTGSYSVTYG